jgi:hypothetical protein
MPLMSSRARASLRAAGAIATIAGGLALAPAPAAANGRFPTSQTVHFRPADVDDIYLATTFGLVLSHDDGATFRWICEQAIGYEGSFDPNYRIGIDGSIYASTYRGLRVSRDGGCTFTTATEALPAGDPGRIADTWIDGLDLGPTGEVWVVTAEGGRPNDVFRSIDAGRTFAPTGLDSDVIWWKSVLVARGDARRVYVTGYQVSQTGPVGEPIPPTVHVRRTDDAGGQWEALPIDVLTLAASPLVMLAAVDPVRPDVLYLRSVRAAGPEGDILYRSADGGRGWREVLRTTDAIRDVVIRGAEVLVATKVGGSHRSTDDGLSFGPMAGAPRANCLADRAGTLFACGANWEPDHFSLGRSVDGQVWTKVFRFVELDGPLACPPGTVQHDTCEVEEWPGLRRSFGIPGGDVDAGVDPPAAPGGCCDASGAAAAAIPAAAIGVLIGVGVWRARRKKRDCCR